MTTLRMALNELRRLAAGETSRLIVIGLCLLPTVGAGLFLYASHDPHAGLERVPAALVLLDEGTAEPDGTRVEAGKDVAESLVDAGDFAWDQVSATTAERGVESGRYEFALTIPREFSAALGGALALDSAEARLSVTTNDAGSWLSSSVAGSVVGTVRDALATSVGAEASEQFLLGFGRVRESLAQAATGAGQVATTVQQAARRSATLRTAGEAHSKGSRALARDTRQLVRSAGSLPRTARRLANAAHRAADAQAGISGVARDISGTANLISTRYTQRRATMVRELRRLKISPGHQARILTVYDSLQAPFDRAERQLGGAADALSGLSSDTGSMTRDADRLAGTLPALMTGLRQSLAGSRRTADQADSLRQAAVGLDQGLQGATTGLTTLAGDLQEGSVSIPGVDDTLRARLAGTLGDPVDVVDSGAAAAQSPGAGLAPLLLALAAWLGAAGLFLLVRPLSRRALAANQHPVRTALGGWLAPTMLGAVQVALALGVTLLVVDVVPSRIPALLGFLVLVSGCFVAVLHALKACFGRTGQVVGLLLLGLQLLSVGGTYPWQTTPPSLHWLHHVPPLGPAVDGLRALMYGGLSGRLVWDVLMLLVWLALGLGASAWAAHRQRVWPVERATRAALVA